MKFVFVFMFLLTSGFANPGVFSDSTIKELDPSTDTTKQVFDEFAIYKQRLKILNDKTPMDLRYNEKVQPFIESYLGVNKMLIAKMQGLKALYFPIFEATLDKYNLPLELKYLAIVESALNPRAKSRSGATGLWQFMYLTGKEYSLEVTSYMDERQDPYKATEAACSYFVKLYEMFGDWNLVLAAYNGGPGYLQRTINNVGSYNFWDLHPHLRKETRNYVPTFIAVNYAMNYAKEHNISTIKKDGFFEKTDTLTLKRQVDARALTHLICVDHEKLTYLNPSYSKDVFPNNSILILPDFAVKDFLDNEESYYDVIELIENKEVLIDEERIVYTVQKGDYLGKIAEKHGVRIHELKTWNTLTTTDLKIGDKLIVFVKKNQPKESLTSQYVVQQGDTLWDIANKHQGLTISKIISLNNLENDIINPGDVIILPAT